MEQNPLNLGRSSEIEKTALTRTIAAERREGKSEDDQSRELSPAELESAAHELDELLKMAERDRGIVATLAKYSSSILAIGAIFPGAVEPLLHAFNDSDETKAAVTQREFVPLGEGLKKAFGEILANYRKTKNFIANSEFEQELDRLKKKTEELASRN